MEIVIAGPEHLHFAKTISLTIEESAKDRGTGIARRTPEYIMEKMQNRNAAIAFEGDEFAGFCYIEIWGHGKYVAHSGLIVAPAFRGQGLAKRIKKRVFDLSLEKFPGAKIFGITTGQAVMKINYELGYKRWDIIRSKYFIRKLRILRMLLTVIFKGFTRISERRLILVGV